MNSDDRADLVFDLADVLNEYNESGHDPEDIREAAVGYIRGWNSE